MRENSVTDEFCAHAGHPDGTVWRFLCRVALEVARRGRASRFDVAPDVWQALAYETAYASVHGSRFVDEIEILTCTGWVAVRCYAELPNGRGAALIGDGYDQLTPLNFEAVL